MAGEIKGIHVLLGFGLGFGSIIAVNLALAYSAVQTFPGLETANSYIASQSFDARRRDQEALAWATAVTLTDGVLRIAFDGPNGPVEPQQVEATLGRATHTTQDIRPQLHFDGTAYTAPVALQPGYWQLRLTAQANDGTPFSRRFSLRVAQ